MAESVVLKRTAITMPDYAAAHGEIWRTAFPARQLAACRATQHGQIKVDFDAKLDNPVPDSGVIESKSLLVAGEHGTVCGPDGTVVPDASWFRGHFGQMPLPAKPYRVQRLQGQALTILSDWSHRSYGHFMQDSMPRLAIYEALGIDIAAFSHVIAGTPTDSCVDLLARAGIDRRQIRRPDDGVALQADNMLIASFPGARRNMEGWAGDFFSRKFPAAAHTARRIYILRKTRRPLNEDALLAMLQPYGFEPYAPETDGRNQAAVFAQAEIVIGAAGSALANLAFCKPGTQVLELLPSDHVFPYYYCMSMAKQLRYHYIVCESAKNRKDSSIGASHENFHVDENNFGQALAALLT
jgi:capsular polysaccharide biosynthesis protein